MRALSPQSRDVAARVQTARSGEGPELHYRRSARRTLFVVTHLRALSRGPRPRGAAHEVAEVPGHEVWLVLDAVDAVRPSDVRAIGRGLHVEGEGVGVHV